MIINVLVLKEDEIKAKIRETMDTDCVYDVNILYNPDTNDVEFEQDTGSWYENDNRVFLAKIRRGISDEDGVALMEMTGLEEWTYLEDFEKFENARDYINDLIELEYSLVLDQIIEAESTANSFYWVEEF
jgi:hypothetical protein